MSLPLRLRVRAFAKINLDLRVLHKRPDGFHEIRTIYQTISLADRLEITFRKARQTSVEVCCSIPIQDNLAHKAAIVALEALKTKAEVHIRIQKRIPLGAGLGGGSADAAAVLLALPALAGRELPIATQLQLAASLGSDVPFFLLGGTAVGVGRGEEVYPLPDLPPAFGLLVVPDCQVSTAAAYRALGRGLTSPSWGDIISVFQSCAWGRTVGARARLKEIAPANDFEKVVFGWYPQLRKIKSELLRLGASPALMSGSGSGIFGIFPDRHSMGNALPSFPKEKVFPFRLLSRASYWRWWRRWLADVADTETWPPKRSQVEASTG